MDFLQKVKKVQNQKVEKATFAKKALLVTCTGVCFFAADHGPAGDVQLGLCQFSSGQKSSKATTMT